MSIENSNEFDPRDFRRALGKFPTGVTIITTRDEEGNPVGMTASSFNSVSVDPPLILWSIDKGSFSTELFRNANHFAVNILSKTQLEMSNRFAGRGQDKFSGVEFTEDAHGCPLFDGTAAQFECKTWSVYEGGDHYIIVGEVTDYRQDQSQIPLVFSGGSYAVPMQHPSVVSDQFLNMPSDGFLGNYLLYLLHMAYTKCAALLYPELQERFAISAEQWRVLTLLGGGKKVELTELGKQVGQPTSDLKETLKGLCDRGFSVVVADAVSLTSEGQDIAEQVFDAARDQESKILSVLSEQQRADLKINLKEVVSAI